ncbi:MAG: amino acid racemase [Bacteroidales bacterium]|nr:amino acid racemase [Bacteroidales bacterium]
MKTIGIIGGLGPEATGDYYREIISRMNELNRGGELNYPEVIIYSVNMSKFLGMLQKKDYKVAAGYIASCIEKLASAGADYAAISANTPHMLFNEIKNQVSIPLISIVEACKTKTVNMGLKRCGLFGTRFTMEADFYPALFAQHGIEVLIPDNNDVLRINELLFSELELGIFKEETRSELLGIVQKMITHQGIDSLILGCTEFPLMFTEGQYLGIPFLNTTRIHVEEIIRECLTN